MSSITSCIEDAVIHFRTSYSSIFRDDLPVANVFWRHLLLIFNLFRQYLLLNRNCSKVLIMLNYSNLIHNLLRIYGLDHTFGQRSMIW